jgi:uncharacterized membrane protein
MTAIAVIVGALIGAMLFHQSVPGGLLIGAGLGFLLATVARLNERVRKLEASQSGAGEEAPLTIPPTWPATVEPPVSAPPITPAVVSMSSTPSLEPLTTRVDAASIEQRVDQVGERVVHFVREFFTGEHAIPRIGVIVLFFGVAFLLKYAAEHSLLPIQLRLLGSAVGALVLLGFGWRLRMRRVGYALVLQGGGVGVLYLTVFAALRLYQLIPPVGAFAMLVAICAFSGALAVLQNARWLAVLGAAGGFLAPILVSAGVGNHVLLFSYYALLNAGILGISWFRAWRELNLIGFGFTFVLGALWGAQHYRAELFASTEPFLITFFVFYVAIAVLFALRQPVKLRGYVDGTLVFGVPVVGFVLQAALVHDYEYGLAWSAAGAGAFYISLASLLWRLRPTALRLLCEAFLALGVVFATLALPLALDGRWTAAAWALEGCAMVWVGVRQQRLLARLFGAVLIVGAGVFFLDDLDRSAIGLAVLNSAYLGTFIIALAALLAARWLARPAAGLTPQERALAAILFGWGLLWWFGGGVREIHEHVQQGYVLDVVIGFAVFSALVAELIGARLGWAWLRAVALGLLPAGLLLALATLGAKSHPFTVSGMAAWAAFGVCHWLLLERREDLSWRRYLDFLHAGAVWLAALLGAQELAWIGAQVATGEAWSLIGWGLAPALAVIAVLSARLGSMPWQAHRTAYLSTGVVPVLAVACLWLVVANVTSRGDPAPLTYVPLLNPLDLVSIAVLLTAAYWYTHSRQLPGQQPLSRAGWAFAAALTFVWLNAALLRTLHHWADVPFQLHTMLDSVLVQASLSIFWTTLALVIMLVATRRGLRALWMPGGALLALVVLKLFVVDLARTGTVARIVSFIVVGVLLLLIGYLAPIPPSRQQKDLAP